MNTTLRARLLLGISATIIITLTTAQCGLFVLIKRQLFKEFDHSLAAKARALAVLVVQDGNIVDIEFQRHPMQEFARVIRPEYYQVWQEDGTVLTRSRQLHYDNLPELHGDRVVPKIIPVELPDGRPGRAAGIRFRPNIEGELPPTPPPSYGTAQGQTAIIDNDNDALDEDDSDYASRPFVTLVVARDIQDLQASLNRLTILLAASGLLAAVTILGVLAWLITRNLRPLQSLAAQLAEINDQTLDQRFLLQNAPGELDPVVTRLNALMACLETAFLREKTFTADVAHELRTPLAGIRSTLEVSLSRLRDADSYQSSIQKALKISEETETIISTLLSLSRMEAGLATLDTDIIDLGHLLHQTWRRFADRAAAAQVDVKWNFEQPIVLKTDPRKLQVVVANLFDNATDYVDPGGSIEVLMFLDDSSNVHVSVRNSGCTLTEEQATQACDRFWRGDRSRSATGQHSGLGLALSQRIIQFLEGQIEISVKDNWFAADITLLAKYVESTEDSFAEEHSPASSEFNDFPNPWPRNLTADHSIL